MEFPFASPQTARLVVEADLDPQFPARVLQRFSERNVLPTRFHALALDEATGLRVELEFDGSADAARLLAKRLLNLPSARSVELSFRRGAALGLAQRAA